MAERTLPRNHWPSARCARAFWSQQDVRPYRRLLADTLDWAAPAAGQTWLDLGCGGGAITRALWERSGATLAGVVGLDCAAVNEQAYARLRATLQPPPGERVRFVCHDFSSGLALFPECSFDHAVSGLSISYAESYSAEQGRWTADAYDAVLAEVRRVLRPGGRFVFSVNVPEPSWLRVALLSLGDSARAVRRLRFLRRSWRMLRYGSWLKREARKGRFHYLPAPVVAAKLAAAGFEHVEHRLSYAGQAYVFRCTRPT